MHLGTTASLLNCWSASAGQNFYGQVAFLAASINSENAALLPEMFAGVPADCCGCWLDTGQLTLRKMAIVSNVNLARVGARLGLLAYHALPLDADSWHPPGLSETLPIKVQFFVWA